MITKIRALYEEKSEKMKGFEQLEWMEREEARLKRIEAKNKRQNEEEARLKRIVDYNVGALKPAPAAPEDIIRINCLLFKQSFI